MLCTSWRGTSWIKCGLTGPQYWLFWEETCSCKWNLASSEKKVKQWSTYGHELTAKKQLRKLILLTGSRGCKAWTTVFFYGRSLSSFIALAADDFEMPVSCARRLNDLCGVCSNLDLNSSSFSSLSSLRFLAGILSRSDPVDLTLLISLWMSVVLGTVIPGNLQRNFLRHFLVEPFHIWFIQKNTLFNSISNHIHPHTKITSTWHNVGHSCTVVWIILAAVAVSTWRWVMQFLPGAGMWQLRSDLSVNALHITTVERLLKIEAALCVDNCQFVPLFRCLMALSAGRTGRTACGCVGLHGPTF
jgi:hypothetical protein